MRLSDFEGSWRIERRITDRMTGQTGRFIGSALLSPDAYGLTYRETGTLHFGRSAPMKAERRYLWRAKDDGIKVLFADGAPFHDFMPDGQEDGTPHLCGDDLYRVRYEFGLWPSWQATWQVAGPRKDYTSVTDYSR